MNEFRNVPRVNIVLEKFTKWICIRFKCKIYRHDFEKKHRKILHKLSACGKYAFFIRIALVIDAHISNVTRSRHRKNNKLHRKNEQISINSLHAHSITYNKFI